MNIHLDEDIFYLVKNGTKNIEIRLNDEKRRKLKIGDELHFIKRPYDDEEICSIVTFLDYYDTFDELISNYEISRLYNDSFNKEKLITLLEKFYSKEEQEKYGVVAIGFKLK